MSSYDSYDPYDDEVTHCRPRIRFTLSFPPSKRQINFALFSSFKHGIPPFKRGIQRIKYALANSHWNNEREFKKYTKPPKVKATRRRRLSIDAGVTNSMQTQCPLFKLPTELRITIYKEIFGRDIHILFENDSFGTARCANHPCQYGNQGYHIDCVYYYRPSEDSIEPSYPHTKITGTMALLQSCRRVYSEMIDVLYTTPRFHFYAYDSMLAFLSSIVPQRFNSICKVHLNTYCSDTHVWYKSIRRIKARNACLPHGKLYLDKYGMRNAAYEVLSKMTNLSELYIDLKFPCRRVRPSKRYIDSGTAEQIVYYIDSDRAEEIEQFYLPSLKRLADGSRGDFRVRLANPFMEEAKWMDLPFMETHVCDKDLMKDATAYSSSEEY